MQETLHSVASVFEAFSRNLITSKTPTGSLTKIFAPDQWEQISDSLSTLKINSVFPHRGKFLGAQLGITNKEFAMSESAHVECNEKKLGVLIENFHRVTITSFFPTVIAHLIEDGTYSSSSPFKEFHFVITQQKEIEKLCSEDARFTLKLWISFIFGKLKNFNADHRLVYTYANTVLSSVLRFAEEWYYIDTLEAWIRLKPANIANLKKCLEHLDFCYEIHSVEFAVFHAKKKFTAQILEDGEKSFISRGFKRESFLR